MSQEIDLYYKVAESMVCMKKYSYGAEIYKRIFDMEIKNSTIWIAGTWHGYADCLEKIGDIDGSKTAYEKAFEYHLIDIFNDKNKNKAHAYLWGGWSALKLGKTELAYFMFKNSVKEDPNYAYSWLSLSVACTKLKLYEEAKEARENYNKYLKINPYRKRECEGRSMLLDAYGKATGWLKEFIEKILPETECEE
ncbi:MAG: tetratricopeptide repeat protein [Thermoplasmata archaeon]|nr:hypothetical protein [Thermoplasmata archaeon]